MSSGGAGSVAAVGGSSGNNHVAKKRRRWSTAQQDTVLTANRLGAKKQLMILGRHCSSSSSSVNSLEFFQSKSNPIFEPSDEPSDSSDNDVKSKAEERMFHFKWSGPTLATSPDGSTRRIGGGAESQQQLQPRSRLGKVSPESSLLNNPAGCVDWSSEEKVDNAMENPIMLLHSPAITGKRAFPGLLQESRAICRDYAGGEWPNVEGEEEVLDERDSRVLTLSLRSSDDGAQSIEGPRSQIDDEPHEEEMLSSLEACERRSRELVEKVQANAAAEVALLRSYKAFIEHLRVECTKHEAAAKEWSGLHKDAMSQLVSARSEVSELERHCSLQATAIAELKQKQGIEQDLQDAMVVSDQLTLETLKKEQDCWRNKVQALEMELMAAKSELSAIAIREAEEKNETRQHVAAQSFDAKLEVEVHVGTDVRGETEAGSINTTLDSADGKLFEVEPQLGIVCKEMEILRQDRDELRISWEDGQRRVAEAERERDAVVLAVQQEWDLVKVALRKEKENLERELTAAWEQNTKLQNELDAKNNNLEAGKQHESRNLEDGGEKSSQVCIGNKIVQPGTERGDGLIALWHDYQKLEVELSEAFEHNKKQKQDLEELNIAVGSVREGNKKLEGEREVLSAVLISERDGNTKLEGELGDLRLQKTKLERERGTLLTAVQEERRKLENERAAVCKAMRGENEKLESEREVLIAMQDYLKKLELKQDKAQAQTIGGDEKRRRKSKRGASQC